MRQLVDTRARRRSAMQENLRAAALRMFAERGFDATTVRDIAEAAQVSERTFFRYYPSKSDVLLTDLRDALDGLLHALALRPASESGLTAICEALLSLPSPAGPPGLSLLLPPTGTPLVRTEDDASGAQVPAATSVRMFKVFAEWEAGLVAALLARDNAGSSPQERLRAEVTARAALAAMRTAVQHRHARDAGGTADPGLFHDLVREAFAVLGAGPAAT